jgi:hypothetical protein
VEAFFPKSNRKAALLKELLVEGFGHQGVPDRKSRDACFEVPWVSGKGARWFRSRILLPDWGGVKLKDCQKKICFIPSGSDVSKLRPVWRVSP